LEAGDVPPLLQRAVNLQNQLCQLEEKKTAEGTFKDKRNVLPELKHHAKKNYNNYGNFSQMEFGKSNVDLKQLLLPAKV
jgi:hypothetical protein